MRFKASLDPHTKRVTLTALLGACGSDLQDLRDAALLSLGYDAVLRVSELVAVTVAHIDPHSDGSALLFIPLWIGAESQTPLQAGQVAVISSKV